MYLYLVENPEDRVSRDMAHFILPDYKINQFRKIPGRMLQKHVTKEAFVGISNETVRFSYVFIVLP